MENVFITITGVKNYFGMKPFKVGKIFRIVKEDDNDYDEEAIRAELPAIDTIGYVANSTSTVYAGTVSAGRLYDKIDDYAYSNNNFEKELLNQIIAFEIEKSVQEDMGCYTVADVTQILPE